MRRFSTVKRFMRAARLLLDEHAGWLLFCWREICTLRSFFGIILSGSHGSVVLCDATTTVERTSGKIRGRGTDVELKCGIATRTFTRK